MALIMPINPFLATCLLVKWYTSSNMGRKQFTASIPYSVQKYKIYKYYILPKYAPNQLRYQGAQLDLILHYTNYTMFKKIPNEGRNKSLSHYNTPLRFIQALLTIISTQKTTISQLTTSWTLCSLNLVLTVIHIGKDGKLLLDIYLVIV